jgi:hypothetical protein
MQVRHVGHVVPLGREQDAREHAPNEQRRNVILLFRHDLQVDTEARNDKPSSCAAIGPPISQQTSETALLQAMSMTSKFTNSNTTAYRQAVVRRRGLGVLLGAENHVLLVPGLVATRGAAVVFQAAFLLALHGLALQLLVALVAEVRRLRHGGREQPLKPTHPSPIPRKISGSMANHLAYRSPADLTKTNGGNCNNY